MRLLKKIIVIVVLVIFVSFLGMVLYGAYNIGSIPDLENWHTIDLERDRLTEKDYPTFEEYIETEQVFLKSIYMKVAPDDARKYNRYIPENLRKQKNERGDNQNGSFELIPADSIYKGGILLVHGLTDSPYHLNSIAEIFKNNGYYVICLRLPGHGTVPAGLLDVEWEDWFAAVRFGAKKVQDKIATDQKDQFFVGGFSTGGALVLRYILETIDSQKGRVPDGLFLFSPAIAVDPLGFLANWHKAISWMPFFEKFKWLEVLPEYDPFKYNSFPKNAGDQIHLLTKANKDLMNRIASVPGKLDKVPPILAFQSMVDATVMAEDLIELYTKIGNPQSELVLFDINRTYERFVVEKAMKESPVEVLNKEGFKSFLIVVSNRKNGDQDGYSKAAKFMFFSPQDEGKFTEKELYAEIEVNWPDYLFAFSHVCIPIAPDDGFYGENALLGNISIKGEKGVLAIGEFDLMRIRYNPFFFLVEDRIKNFIQAQLAGVVKT